MELWTPILITGRGPLCTIENLKRLTVVTVVSLVGCTSPVLERAWWLGFLWGRFGWFSSNGGGVLSSHHEWNLDMYSLCNIARVWKWYNKGIHIITYVWLRDWYFFYSKFSYVFLGWCFFFCVLRIIVIISCRLRLERRRLSAGTAHKPPKPTHRNSSRAWRWQRVAAPTMAMYLGSAAEKGIFRNTHDGSMVAW